MWTPHFQVCKLSQRLSQCLAVTICPTSRKGPLASLSLCASLLLTQSLSVPGFSSRTMRPGLQTTSKCRSPPVFCWHGAESSCQTIRDKRPWDPLSLQRACRPKLPGRANQRELCSCASAGRLCTISNIYILGCSRSVAKKTFVFNFQSRHRFLAPRAVAADTRDGATNEDFRITRGVKKLPLKLIPRALLHPEDAREPRPLAGASCLSFTRCARWLSRACPFTPCFACCPVAPCLPRNGKRHMSLAQTPWPKGWPESDSHRGFTGTVSALCQDHEGTLCACGVRESEEQTYSTSSRRSDDACCTSRRVRGQLCNLGATLIVIVMANIVINIVIIAAITNTASIIMSSSSSFCFARICVLVLVDCLAGRELAWTWHSRVPPVQTKVTLAPGPDICDCRQYVHQLPTELRSAARSTRQPLRESPARICGRSRLS